MEHMETKEIHNYCYRSKQVINLKTNTMNKV